MKNKRGANKQATQGFTLVEIAVGVAVFSLTFWSIVLLSFHTLERSKKANQELIATHIAKSRLEQLYNMDYDSLPTMVETNAVVNEVGTSNANGQFRRTTTVTTNFDGRDDLTQVSVSVDYELRGEWEGKPIVLTTVYVEE